MSTLFQARAKLSWSGAEALAPGEDEGEKTRKKEKVTFRQNANCMFQYHCHPIQYEKQAFFDFASKYVIGINAADGK